MNLIIWIHSESAKLFIFDRNITNIDMLFKRFLLVLFSCLSANLLLAKAPVFTEKDYFTHPPRIIRTCCAFGTDLRVSIIPGYKYTMLSSPEILGPHHYLGHKLENNGIIYTRRGGFLDFGHLRDYIDWTAYLYNLEKKSQQTGEIHINLGFEAGYKSLVIKIPASEKEDDLINLAGRIAYDLSIWHEISSWFGATAVPLVSERFSSFTVEDAYSNLLGSKIAAEAIKSELPYEQAVTEIIRLTLIDLEAVSTKDESYQAMEAVRDIWWTRKKHLPNNKVTLQRQLGVYYSILPCIVPGWDSKNNPPYKLTVPETTLDGIPLSEFYTLTFDRNRKVPVKKIFPDRPNRLVTQNDFREIITYIALRMQKTNTNFMM
jgi:hypothetical protein